MLPSSCCLDLGALHVGSSGMPSMCVGQTIGRLCQPAPGVLGGLSSRERHLSFHLSCVSSPALYWLLSHSSSATETGRFSLQNIESLSYSSSPDSSWGCLDKEEWYLAPAEGSSHQLPRTGQVSSALRGLAWPCLHASPSCGL